MTWVLLKLDLYLQLLWIGIEGYLLQLFADRSCLRSSVVFYSDDDKMNIYSSFAFKEIMAQETKICTNNDIYLLEKCLEALHQKRGSTRERALSIIVSAFESSLQRQFSEKNYITLHYFCMKSFKQGSINEISLASCALGLLAITVGSRDCVHELLEESIQLLSQALTSVSEVSNKLSVLDCLAIITFVGVNNCVETQRSMQVIWNLIHQKSGSNVISEDKPTSAILAEAVSAWSFLLATIDGWKIDSYYWRESLSLLSSLLHKDDFSVCIAAGCAIALIYETGNLSKFCGETKSCDSSGMVEENPFGEFSYVEGLKDKILNQVRKLTMKAGGNGSSKNYLSNQRNLFKNVLEFLETGVCPETSIKICYSPLKISTWTQLIQLNFFERFLGSAFISHMQGNELLQDIFDFTPKEEDSSDDKECLFSCEMKLVAPNPKLGKGKAQLKEKHMLAQEMKVAGVGNSFRMPLRRQARN